MKKEQMMVQVCDLIHAEWNPRTENDLSPENEEMKKLIASIREIGVVQPIAVWDDGAEDNMVVIAGNRRFEAACIIGLKEIPAMVFEGITLAQAQEITRVENEVRLGVDPIRDAGLIGSMMQLGYEQKEIAAHFGVSEATICRRAKLLELIPEVREIALLGFISTNALEKIALHTPDIQKRCLREVKKASEESEHTGETVKWNQLKWKFTNETKELSGAKFDTACCKECCKRTGAQADLWGEVPEGGDLGRCLDCKCFMTKFNEYIVGRVQKKVGKDVELVDAGAEDIREYEIRDDKAFSKKRTKKAPCAWWFYTELDDSIEIIYGPSLADYNAAADKRAADAKQAEEERKASSKAEQERLENVTKERYRISKLRRPLEESLKTCVDKIWDGVNRSNETTKLFAKHVFSGSKVSMLLADALICGFMDSYDFEEGLDEGWQVDIIDAYPALAKALKVKSADLAKAKLAKANLAEFDKKNPMPEY